jgi:hypothetical protein
LAVERSVLVQAVRERVVITQGALIVVLTLVIVAFALVLAGAKSSAACSSAQASAQAGIQTTRQALGNEGRAAASALASSVLAAAASPGSIRTTLVSDAEKTYATTMITVNAGLAEHPVPVLRSC